MSLTLTDSEMLERRCHSWEKTRQRGKLVYAIVRGVIWSGLWFLMNSLVFGYGKHGMSYESMAVVSFFFFLVGCWEAPKSWDRAEKRYQSDKQYLEVMRQQDSNTLS